MDENGADGDEEEDFQAEELCPWGNDSEDGGGGGGGGSSCWSSQPKVSSVMDLPPSLLKQQQKEPHTQDKKKTTPSSASNRKQRIILHSQYPGTEHPPTSTSSKRATSFPVHRSIQMTLPLMTAEASSPVAVIPPMFVLEPMVFLSPVAMTPLRVVKPLTVYRHTSPAQQGTKKNADKRGSINMNSTSGSSSSTSSSSSSDHNKSLLPPRDDGKLPLLSPSDGAFLLLLDRNANDPTTGQARMPVVNITTSPSAKTTTKSRVHRLISRMEAFRQVAKAPSSSQDHQRTQKKDRYLQSAHRVDLPMACARANMASRHGK